MWRNSSDHEGLAEAHDLVVGLAVGVEVGAALAAAHGQAGQAVLEDLLEAQELQGAEGDVGVEAEAALVGADGAVELDAVAAVDADLALVVHPGHAEDDGALGLDDPLEDGVLLVLRLLLEDRGQGVQDLGGGLDEEGFPGGLLLEALKDFVDVLAHGSSRKECVEKDWARARVELVCGVLPASPSRGCGVVQRPKAGRHDSSGTIGRCGDFFFQEVTGSTRTGHFFEDLGFVFDDM